MPGHDDPRPAGTDPDPDTDTDTDTDPDPETDPDADPARVLRWLAGPDGTRVLAVAAEVAAPGPLVAAERLRRRFPTLAPGLRAAALAQLELRARATGRLGPDAAGMLLTRDGLEQATRASVAGHRAASLASRSGDRVHTVADLCCGLGGDLLALARAGFAATGVDIDPAAVVAARTNLAAAGLPGQVRLADVTAFDRTGFDAVVADPARRSGQHRISDPAAFRPDWTWVRSLLTEPGIRACVSTTPALPHRLVPAGCEAEWVGDGREVVELALWSPELGSGAARRVTLLGSSGTTTITETALTAGAPPVRQPQVGDVLIEPHGAVIRAGLVGVVAQRVAGALPAPGIAYVLCPLTPEDAVAALGQDGPGGPALGSVFVVSEVLPVRERVLRRRLAQLRVGRLEILQRGLDITPDALRPRLIGGHPPGAAAATLVLTRTSTGGAALLVRRHLR